MTNGSKNGSNYKQNTYKKCQTKEPPITQKGGPQADQIRQLQITGNF